MLAAPMSVFVQSLDSLTYKILLSQQEILVEINYSFVSVKLMSKYIGTYVEV